MYCNILRVCVCLGNIFPNLSGVVFFACRAVHTEQIVTAIFYHKKWVVWNSM